MTDWALPEIDQKKCVLCGLCVDACPQHVMELLVKELAIVRPQDCSYCGLCEQTCPENAVACYFEISWA